LFAFFHAGLRLPRCAGHRAGTGPGGNRRESGHPRQPARRGRGRLRASASSAWASTSPRRGRAGWNLAGDPPRNPGSPRVVARRQGLPRKRGLLTGTGSLTRAGARMTDEPVVVVGGEVSAGQGGVRDSEGTPRPTTAITTAGTGNRAQAAGPGPQRATPDPGGPPVPLLRATALHKHAHVRQGHRPCRSALQSDTEVRPAFRTAQHAVNHARPGRSSIFGTGLSRSPADRHRGYPGPPVHIRRRTNLTIFLDESGLDRNDLQPAATPGLPENRPPRLWSASSRLQTLHHGSRRPGCIRPPPYARAASSVASRSHGGCQVHPQIGQTGAGSARITPRADDQAGRAGTVLWFCCTSPGLFAIRARTCSS